MLYKITGGFMEISRKDLKLAKSCSWSILRCKSNKNYAIGRPFGTKSGKILFHRFIMGLGKEKFSYDREVDHRDGDGLNNKRRNLRIVNHSTNIRNRKSAQINSRLKERGITKLPYGGFRVFTSKNRKFVHIGVYKTLTEAIKIRNNLLRKQV